jgi:hypothetical protein
VTVKAAVNSLILCALCSCGAPGSDKVFIKGTAKAGADSTQVAVTPPPPPRPRDRITPKRFAGLYRRQDDSSRFQPCGTKAPLDVIGTGEARYSLQERFRWNSVWVGRPMYGVFAGAIVTDTPVVQVRGVPQDSVPRVPRTRFFITAVESLRTWQQGDCGGMRIP